MKVLEMESKSATGWFKNNDIIVNPDKFQAMIISCDKKKRKKYNLNINNSIIISSVDSVTLFGVEIDTQLNFEKHVSITISF